MAELLRYAVEIDLRGNYIGGAWEHTQTNATFGFYSGYIRACTGTANLTIEGKTFRPGFLLEQFKGERQAIDITEGGNYATFSTLDFELNNTGGLWDWLRAQGIFTKNAPVRFWAVEGTTAYLHWVGVVDEDSFGIDALKLSCIDSSKTLHKTCPPETLNPSAFGWASIEEESAGAVIPVCLGSLQDALLLPATKAENRFQGVFKDSAWESVGHIAYFPSATSQPTYAGAANDLQQVVVCVGLAQFDANAFAGKYIRAISGEGEGIVRRVQSSSASRVIGKWSEGDGAIVGLATYEIYGVLLTLDSSWAFEMVAGEGETDPPTTAPDWIGTASYSTGSTCSYGGEVFRALSTQAAGSEPPGATNPTGWKAIYHKFPTAQGDTAFCPDGSAINKVYLASNDWVPAVTFDPQGNILGQSLPLLLGFSSAVTIIECFAFDATLIASQNAVSEIDLVRDTAAQRAGLLTKKDGATIPLPDIGEVFNSGLFSGRSYSGVRLSRASFAADKKLTASQRIGSVAPMGCFMGATMQANTPTGYISYTWNPPIYLQQNPERLNDPDPAQFVGAEFNYSFLDSAGVTYDQVGKFPSVAPNYATAWEIHALVRTLPDADEISGAKDIIPALRAKLFIDCPAAFTTRADYAIEVSVRCKLLSRLLFKGTATLKSETLSIAGAGTIEKEISLFSFFEKDSEALFVGLLEAIKIDSVVQGKRLRDWLEAIDCKLIVRLHPTTFIAAVQPYLYIYEGGLAAKGDIELGDFRCSLRGETWGSLSPGRFDAASYPNTFPQVAEYLMRSNDGLGDSEIDTASIDALLPIGALQSIQVSRQLVDAKNSREYLIELAAQGMFGIVQVAGKRALRSWLDETTPVRAFEPGAADAINRISDGTLQDVAKVPLSKVPTEARLRFNYSTPEKKYLSELYITRTWEEEFPAIDAVAFGGGAVADVVCYAPSIVDLVFAGAAPEITFGDLFGFTAGGVQYIGQAAQKFTRPDGVEVISVYGWDSGSRLLFSLPAADIGVTYAAQSVSPLGGFLWQQYAQGFDAQHYAEAKAIWERFRNAYKRVRQVQGLPSRLGDCPWIHSSDLLNQDIGSAVLYLDRISKWVTKPREEVAFEVQAEGNLGLRLLDPVSFTDPLLFGGSTRLGWLTEIYLLPNRGSLGLQVILSDDPLDPYQEEQQIDEGFGIGTIGNLWGDIDESTTADNIDEQGGY